MNRRYHASTLSPSHATAWHRCARRSSSVRSASISSSGPFRPSVALPSPRRHRLPAAPPLAKAAQRTTSKARTRPTSRQPSRAQLATNRHHSAKSTDARASCLRFCQQQPSVDRRVQFSDSDSIPRSTSHAARSDDRMALARKCRHTCPSHDRRRWQSQAFSSPLVALIKDRRDLARQIAVNRQRQLRRVVGTDRNRRKYSRKSSANSAFDGTSHIMIKRRPFLPRSSHAPPTP